MAFALFKHPVKQLVSKLLPMDQLSQDLEFDYTSAQVDLLSERMAGKLQAYVRRNIHQASQEILASTMVSFQGLERRLRLRIHANLMHYKDQVEQLKDHLHDVREEIWQLIEKQGTKQEFNVTQILEDIRELNKCFHQALNKGIRDVGSSKSNFDEEVSESGRKMQNIGKAFKPTLEQSGLAAVSNKHDEIQEVATMHVKSSSLLIEPLPLHDSNVKALRNTSTINQATVVPAVDTEVISENNCSLVGDHVADDKNIRWPVGSEEAAFKLSCKESQNEKKLHVKDPLEPFRCKCDTKVQASKTGQQGEPDSREHKLRAFLFMDDAADSQGASDHIQGIEDSGFVSLKRSSECKFTMPSKRQHLFKEKSAFVAKQRQCTAIKPQRGYKRPNNHFTNLDVERLVMAVDKFGIGRWRDIKEAYFSVDRYISAANLKDKWRSLLHSTKRNPAKQRSLKPSPVLVKRVLQIEQRDKLSHTRTPTSQGCKLQPFPPNP